MGLEGLGEKIEMRSAIFATTTRCWQGTRARETRGRWQGGTSARHNLLLVFDIKIWRFNINFKR